MNDKLNNAIQISDDDTILTVEDILADFEKSRQVWEDTSWTNDFNEDDWITTI